MFFSVIIYTLFWAFSKKTWKATLLSYVLIFILSIVNQLKVTFTKDPLTFSDVHFLKNIGDIFGLATGNVSTGFVASFVVIIIVYAAILAGITYCSYKHSF